VVKIYKTEHSKTITHDKLAVEDYYQIVIPRTTLGVNCDRFHLTRASEAVACITGYCRDIRHTVCALVLVGLVALSGEENQVRFFAVHQM